MRSTLTPVTKVSGWEYRSTDGVWSFVHMDEPGTPWSAIHIATDRHASFSSLRAARIAAASGALLAYLDDTQPLATCAGVAR